MFRSYQHYRFVKLLSKIPAYQSDMVSIQCVPVEFLITKKMEYRFLQFCNSLIGFFPSFGSFERSNEQYQNRSLKEEKKTSQN